MGINGPFFPQFRSEADALELIPGRGPLTANASASQSEWMDWIGLPCAWACQRHCWRALGWGSEGRAGQ